MISFKRKNQIRTVVNDISYVIFYIDLTKRKLFWVELIRIRHEWYDKWTPPHHHLSNTGLTTYLSMAYMFTKPLELLIHRLGSPKCVVARISGCPDIFDVKINFLVTVRRTGTFLVYIYMVISDTHSNTLVRPPLSAISHTFPRPPTWRQPWKIQRYHRHKLLQGVTITYQFYWPVWTSSRWYLQSKMTHLTAVLVIISYQI